MTVVDPKVPNGRLNKEIMNENDANSDIEGDFSDPEDFIDTITDEGTESNGIYRCSLMVTSLQADTFYCFRTGARYSEAKARSK